MDKVRINEVAQELGIETKEVLTKAKELKLPAKAANSAITIADAEVLANYILTGKAPEVKTAPKSKESSKPDYSQGFFLGEPSEVVAHEHLINTQEQTQNIR